MKTIKFSPLFSDAILSGTKKSTIRKTHHDEGKRVFIKVDHQCNSIVSDKQFEKTSFCMAEIKSCQEVCLEIDGFSIFDILGDEVRVDSKEQMDEFAVSDGFSNYEHMVNWFQCHYQKPIPFFGFLTKWEYLNACT